jgi:hypothetical protein
MLLLCLFHTFFRPKELFAQMNEPVLDEVGAMEGTIFSFSHYLPRQDGLNWRFLGGGWSNPPRKRRDGKRSPMLRWIQS